jgi:hypothetical protein
MCSKDTISLSLRLAFRWILDLLAAKARLVARDDEVDGPLAASLCQAGR